MALFAEIKPLINSFAPFGQLFGHSRVVTQVRNYAARKGTRERRKKNIKAKVEEVKVGFIPHNLRNKEKLLASRPKRKFDDSWKQIAKDNVYPIRYYKWPVYSFAEAIAGHRETHHPDMYNQPNAKVHVSIELNMETDKKTKFLDNFYRIAAMPHPFDHGEERTILAFSKDAKLQELARAAGAHLVGGVELIKEIQNGAVSLHDFQYVIAHPGILPELVSLRGLMKKKFPNPKSGTMDVDFIGIVNRIMRGVNYSGLKDEYEKDFALAQVVVGSLDMDTKQLEENFSALLADLWTTKPKSKKDYIRRCLVTCPPSSEKFKVDHSLYVGAPSTQVIEEEDDDDEEEEPIEAKA